MAVDGEDMPRDAIHARPERLKTDAQEAAVPVVYPRDARVDASPEGIRHFDGAERGLDVASEEDAHLCGGRAQRGILAGLESLRPRVRSGGVGPRRHVEEDEGEETREAPGS